MKTEGMESAPLVNRVAQSGLITINLEEYFPEQEIIPFDLKDYLFQGLILKEKDFRSALKEYDWEKHDGQILCAHCTTDAIIPVWAYMLVAGLAAPHVHDVFQGTPDEYLKQYYRKVIGGIDAKKYEGERIVIKGCSHKPVPASAYLDLTQKLQPFAQSIMYGEPCSTVPIFKRPRKIVRK